MSWSTFYGCESGSFFKSGFKPDLISALNLDLKLFQIRFSNPDQHDNAKPHNQILPKEKIAKERKFENDDELKRYIQDFFDSKHEEF